MINTQNILLELEPNRLINILNVAEIYLKPEELRISVEMTDHRPKNFNYINQNEYNLALLKLSEFMK